MRRLKLTSNSVLVSPCEKRTNPADHRHLRAAIRRTAFSLAVTIVGWPNRDMTRKHLQTRSLSERSTDLEDLYDYARPRPSRRARKRKAENKIIVTDDWPEIVPITEAELRVIEAHSEIFSTRSWGLGPDFEDA